jgi:SAM-dependent methyltransferase
MGQTPMPQRSIRSRYEDTGVERFYRGEGSDYRNPHEEAIGSLLSQIVPAWKLDLSNVLDLAAGSGEATLALRRLGAKRIAGIDPYTSEAYRRRTGATAERLTFADVAAGALRARQYSLIVCSFALHLCEPSRLPRVAQELSLIAPTLLIITPHKRPVIRPAWGWTLEAESVVQRVRARLYRLRGGHFSVHLICPRDD